MEDAIHAFSRDQQQMQPVNDLIEPEETFEVQGMDDRRLSESSEDSMIIKDVPQATGIHAKRTNHSAVLHNEEVASVRPRGSARVAPEVEPPAREPRAWLRRVGDIPTGAPNVMLIISVMVLLLLLQFGICL